MTVSAAQQLMILLYGVITGAICAAMACVLNAAREELRLGTTLSMVCDLLFWIFAGVTVVWMNLRFGDGSIRIYQILAAICGFLLYTLLPGKLTEKAARLILRGIKILLSPAVFLWRGVTLYVKKIREKAGAFTDRIKKSLERAASAGKVRKKIRKNYKKML